MSGDPGIRGHRRQFIVGSSSRCLVDGWVARSLGDGLHLSHCPELRIGQASDADGCSWTLLGLASQTVADRPDPLIEIERSATDTIPLCYEAWAGRWALIGAGEIHLDAMAQLGCHWTIDPDGAPWASSSPAAVAAIEGAGLPRPLELHYERGLSWVVPPLGRRTGVRRLLPSQVLDLRSGATRPRRLVTPAGDLIGVEPLAAFGTAIAEGMRRLPTDRRRLLSLTAGADSRVVLAAAVAGGIDVELFTRRSARMSVADRQIPPRLAASVGLDHREVVPKSARSARAELAVAHTDGHVSAGDALPFVQAVRDDFDGVEIGGQGFGIGKVKERVLPADIGEPAETAELLADHFGEPSWSPNRVGLAAWLATVGEQQAVMAPEETVDWRDRIYIEQRMAGWEAAKEQLYDLHRHERMMPINAARTLGLLLAVPEEQRLDGAHQRALIGALDERLLAEPFNPPGDSFDPMTRLRHLLTVDPAGAIGRSIGRLRRRGRGGPGSGGRRVGGHPSRQHA